MRGRTAVTTAGLSAFWLALATCSQDPMQSTEPPPEPDTVLVGAGDIADCTYLGDDQTANLLDAIPGTVFTAGDNAYPDGTAADYTNCYEPTWGRHRSRTRAALGNHEYAIDTLLAGPSFDYFGAALGERGKGYYSYDIGSWHVVVLNDNSDYVDFNRGSAQEQWLVADLARNGRRCVLAIWHQPRFFSSNTPGFNLRTTRKILWDDLYAANADVVINGHQHIYERFTPMNPDGTPDASKGIRQFIVGTGGSDLAEPTVIAPNSEIRDGSTSGVLKLTLKYRAYAWRFIPVTGQTFADSGSGTCH